jgi:hypothetical protein
VELQEKDFIYDKSFECPVCDSKITAKVVKSGKAKLLHTDKDLRAVYQGVDPQKYDVIACEHCGYSVLTRYFQPLPASQIKAVREKVSKNVKMKPYKGETYTYEEASERYQLALVCAIVKQAKASERAYICLKSAWVLRGWQEELAAEKGREEEISVLKEQEQEYLKNALEGFSSALASESFPMCGMDSDTVDYLIAVLALENGQIELASKRVASILVSRTANTRIKDKARDLKEEILIRLKKTT